MTGKFHRLIFTILTVSAAVTQAGAEYVFMKDGSILEGKVVSDASEHIVLKTREPKTMKIERKKILRLLYTNLNLSRMYIQLRTGESVVAYLVDEDRDDYLFRKELYKPEEFKVSRKDVLFMSEKNPSALKGEASTNKVLLSWLPPYGQVKVYKIYMKQKKGDEYTVVATSVKNEINIGNLATQGTYFFIVRAVDDSDYETSPSNEIQVITKSSLPEAPVVRGKKDEKGSWRISWDAATDEDGTVENYRIYSEKNGKFSLYKEVKGLSAEITSETEFDTVQVRSVDNNGDESEIREYRGDWRFQLVPRFWIPVGEMSTFAGNGYGVTLDASKRDLFFNDFELGATAGWMSIEGKKKIGKGNSNVTSLNIYPVSVFAAYRIPVIFDRFNCYDIFSLYPRVSAGFMVMQMNYELLDNRGAVDSEKSAVVLEPFIRGGGAEYGLTRNVFFTAGCEFTYMIDTIQGLGAFELSASAGFRF